MPRDDIEGAYRRLLDPATLTGGAFRAAAELYRQAVAVPADAEHGLRLLCWMIHSRSERRTPSEPAELLRGRFVRLWAAELESGRA